MNLPKWAQRNKHVKRFAEKSEWFRNEVQLAATREFKAVLKYIAKKHFQSNL